MSAAARRAKKDRLWKQQYGCCYYCKGPMIRHTNARKPPKRLATLEHLDDRLSPDRGARPGQLRVVLACFECNNLRSRDRYMQLPLEERRRRSGAQPGVGWTQETGVAT